MLVSLVRRFSAIDVYTRLFIAFILAHIAIWWLFSLLLFYPSDLANDMAEAFSWGKEFQAGYYKHPPFWAWIAALWFKLLPTTNWAFHLLAIINAAAGLVGVWMVAGFFLKDRQRLIAVMLLEFVPFFHFLAFNYNANSIQLSLWPWMAYFLLMSLERRTLPSAVCFGLLAAAAILSKYSAAIFLACCLMVSLIHPQARRYWTSVSPYLSMLVFVACVAPHFSWCWHAASSPSAYLETRTTFPFSFIFQKVIVFLIGCVLFHTGLTFVLAFLLGDSNPRASKIVDLVRQPHVGILIIFAVGPTVLMAVIALLGNVKISTNSAIPNFAFVPLAAVVLLQAQFEARAMRTLVLATGLLVLGAFLFALPTAAAKFAANSDHYNEPRAEIAREVTTLWRKRYRVPLKIVAGTEDYALAATFYSPDQPSDFTNFSFAYAPWITAERLRRDGFAVICIYPDTICRERAMKLLGADFTQVISFQKPRFFRIDGHIVAVQIWFFPPGRSAVGFFDRSPTPRLLAQDQSMRSGIVAKGRA